jgi:gas vesicle protein
MKSVGLGLVSSFVAGSAIGAVCGLLFAPKKGSEMRDDIYNKVVELEAEMEKMGSNFLHLKHNGSLADGFRSKIRDLEKQIEKLTKKAVS